MKLDTVSRDGTGLISIQNTEYELYISRRRFKNDTLKIKESYSAKIGEITKSRTLGYVNTKLPYSMSFEVKYETEKLGNNIVIKPFLNLPLSKNNLTQLGNFSIRDLFF